MSSRSHFRVDGQYNSRLMKDNSCGLLMVIKGLAQLFSHGYMDMMQTMRLITLSSRILSLR